MVYCGRCTNVPEVLQANSNPHPTPFCPRQRQSLKFTRSSIILVQGQNSGEASLKVACNSVLDTIGKEMLSNKDQQSPNQAGPSPTLDKNLKVKTISKHLNTQVYRTLFSHHHATVSSFKFRACSSLPAAGNYHWQSLSRGNSVITLA